MFRAKEFRARSFRAFRGNSSPFISVLLSYARDRCKKRELFRSNWKKKRLHNSNSTNFQIRTKARGILRASSSYKKRCLYRKNKTMVRRYTHKKREFKKAGARAPCRKLILLLWIWGNVGGEIDEVGNLLFFRSGGAVDRSILDSFSKYNWRLRASSSFNLFITSTI